MKESLEIVGWVVVPEKGSSGCTWLLGPFTAVAVMSVYPPEHIPEYFGESLVVHACVL